VNVFGLRERVVGEHAEHLRSLVESTDPRIRRPRLGRILDDGTRQDEAGGRSLVVGLDQIPRLVPIRKTWRGAITEQLRRARICEAEASDLPTPGRLAVWLLAGGDMFRVGYTVCRRLGLRCCHPGPAEHVGRNTTVDVWQ
jgi:hypothetical protein